MERCDLLVIGGGVVGLSAARAWALRHPGSRVVVLEKEADTGAHASGRNSGVLHAGFYYGTDSLKARFSVEGNRQMAAFCDARGVPVRRCGKLVVCRDDAERDVLDLLFERGRANGARIERLSAEDARRIEPRIRTHGAALWSPDTAVVDPIRVVRALAADAVAAGVSVRTGTSFTGRTAGIVTTASGPIGAGRILNCAGAYADRVAAAWGAGSRWALVPFRGAYVLGDPSAPPLACCVYPVPDLAMPFLGVHLTVTTDGGLKIGPTAAPARWREDYGGTGGFSGPELSEQSRIQLRLLRRDATFRRHAVRELAKHSRTWLVREASRLVSGLERRAFRTWGRPGIRAQLVERETGALVSDFVVEEASRSLHVLNAVSPAFTCSLPFAEHLVDRLEALG
jgi:L-2-hydroxyglutarate oxidase